MGESEEREGDPKVEDEVRVECVAVEGGVLGERPAWQDCGWLHGLIVISAAGSKMLRSLGFARDDIPLRVVVADHVEEMLMDSGVVA